MILEQKYISDPYLPALDRVNSRVQTRGNGESATTRTDAFGYNTRSELTSATLGNAAYAYAFDYIGNRNSASEAGTQLAYTANALNQYSTVTETEAFTPTYDADGNATLIKTATGTWSVSYNGENRPVRFENAGTQTVVECGYDSLGRRFEKKVSVAGTLVLHERYAYRGFLQIAAFDVAGTQEPALKRVIYWDPTEETTTRPLAVNILGDNVYFPTVDLTKNVCELVDFYGNVAATYDYAPFGNVSAASPAGTTVPANPLQWSSEIYDSELDLVYYNYRHYSPSLGRFLSRDPIEEQGGLNLYAFVKNMFFVWDRLGLRVELISTSYEALAIRSGVLVNWHKSEFRGVATPATIRNKKKISISASPPSMQVLYNPKFFSSIGKFKKSREYAFHERKHFEDFVRLYNIYAEAINSYEGIECSKCIEKLTAYNSSLFSRFSLQVKEATLTLHYDEYDPEDLLREYESEKDRTAPKISKNFSENNTLFYKKIYEHYEDLLNKRREEISLLDAEVSKAKEILDTCLEK